MTLMKNDPSHFLKLAHECLLSIGVSLELDSMILSFTSTFKQKTGASKVLFYMQQERGLSACFGYGKDEFDMSRYAYSMSEPLIEYGLSFNYIVLPIFADRLLFVFEKGFDDEYLEQIATIIFGFKNKIAIAKNSCINVEKIKNLNESLEDRIQEELDKNRQKEKLLLTQSKQAVMGEMLLMIAHQWRQPLTAIGMIANNIYLDTQMQSLTSDKLQADLKEISSITLFLSKTIDNFGNFFKPDKAKEEFYIKDLLDDTTTLVKKLLDAKGVNFSVHIVDDVVLCSYKNEFIQVLINLIKNSQDALEQREVGTAFIDLEVYLCDQKDALIIRVCDNAGGISKEIGERIFDPYFSTKSEKNGTGLGLYMSKTIIVEHLGGKIWFENTKDGVCFYIKVPI